MTRIMRDSTTATDIPLAGLDLVAGYRNGHWAWSAADWARFPASMPRVVIDVLGFDPATASVLDVETGDATPGAAPGWVKERAKLIQRAYCTIYCNRATQPAVKEAMDSAGLRVGMDYQWWIATLDGDRATADRIGSEPGVMAVQWKGQAQTGGHYDESIVYSNAWHAPPVEPWLRDLEIKLQQISVAAANAATIVKQHM